MKEDQAPPKEIEDELGDPIERPTVTTTNPPPDPVGPPPPGYGS